jgi:hypothetical protein
MAERDMMVPRMGWPLNRTNSEFGSKLWFTLWPRVALYLKSCYYDVGCSRFTLRLCTFSHICNELMHIGVPFKFLTLELVYICHKKKHTIVILVSERSAQW